MNENKINCPLCKSGDFKKIESFLLKASSLDNSPSRRIISKVAELGSNIALLFHWPIRPESYGHTVVAVFRKGSR